MKVELFTAGCKFCNDVESQVRQVTGDQHDVVVYNMNDENNADKYFKTAKNYGINSLPSVVVNGELLTCCSRKDFDPQVLSKALQ